MEWLGLQFVTELPESGQVILDCSHNPFLVMVAYLVACAASFATLDMAERVVNAEDPGSRRIWRWIGATCLAGGIWAMHFIGMLAFQTPIDIQYDLGITLFSLLIALLASWLAMQTLSEAQPSALHCLKTAFVIGLGIAGMHYVGMAAMRMQPGIDYDPLWFIASILIAIGAAGAALWIAFRLRQNTPYVRVARGGAAVFKRDADHLGQQMQPLRIVKAHAAQVKPLQRRGRLRHGVRGAQLRLLHHHHAGLVIGAGDVEGQAMLVDRIVPELRVAFRTAGVPGFLQRTTPRRHPLRR